MNTQKQDHGTGHLVQFATADMKFIDGVRRSKARAQNFSVESIETEKDGLSVSHASEFESFVLFPFVGATISTAHGHAKALANSAVILPIGQAELRLDAPGTCYVLTPLDAEGDEHALNRAIYARRNSAVAPIGPLHRRLNDDRSVRVYEIDKVQASAARPRLKMLQSTALSINWIEYTGPRDRTTLSPHSHTDFEQGSLAIRGDFIHHLRAEWGSNADEWLNDSHLPAPSPSLMVIPPTIIHTTEGVGPGKHLLIDVFCPPRRDFIESGWVANSSEYEAPYGAARSAS